MFCGNCGAPMNDEDKVCAQCGTPVENDMKMASDEMPVVKEKNKKIVIMLAAGVAVLIIIVLFGINVINSGRGYKVTLGKMVDALQNYDVSALESLASSVSDEVYSDEYGDDYYDQYEYRISEVLDKYEDKVGAIKKVSYEIANVKEISEYRLDEMKDELIDEYNMDADKITEIVLLDVRLTVKGSNKSAVYKVKDLYMIKEDGEWKIYIAPY